MQTDKQMPNLISSFNNVPTLCKTENWMINKNDLIILIYINIKF